MDFNQQYGNLRNDIETSINEINSFADRVAKLNDEIRRVENRGANANDLRDTRDQLINDIAERINVRVVEQEPGLATVFVSGIPLVIYNKSIDIEATFDPNGQAGVQTVDTGTPLKINGGRLQGLLALRNEIVPDLQARFDELSSTLAQSFDKVHSTGVGVTGAFTQLTSTRPVDDVTALLEENQLAFPPKEGKLFVGLTNLSTGVRVVSPVDVNPAMQMLDDNAVPNSMTSLADAISEVDNLTAISNDQTGTLTLLADAGYRFDFTGGLGDVDPTGIANTGGTAPDTVPTVGGTYTGETNDQYTFEVIQPGTTAGPALVGITTGLQIRVKDAAGTVLTNLDVGDSYEIDTPLEVANGVTVSLSAGGIDAGVIDPVTRAVTGASTFSIEVIGDADTANILPALGLNTFFTGNDALTIDVNPELVEDPGRIASSVTRQPGDSTNVQRLVALRNQRLLADGTQTFREFTAEIVADVGVHTQEFNQLKETSQLLGERLEGERQSISGVDPNEELVDMLRFQRQFEVSSRYIASINEAFDSLLSII